MAAQVKDEQHATRLARAILTDIQLYNEETIATAPSLLKALADPLSEGRQLFASRVVPSLVAIFDREVLAWLGRLRPAEEAQAVASTDHADTGARQSTAPSTSMPAPAPATARRSAESVYAELANRGQPSAPTPRGPSAVMLLAGVVALLAGLVVAYLLARS